MGISELILLSAGLAMDAFSVAVCRGLRMRKINYADALLTALFFGAFQAMMPLAGYILGNRFESYIASFSHLIALILLGFIGGKMLFEAIHEGCTEESCTAYKLEIKELFILAIATSIDALAVGIVFATEKVNLSLSLSMIGVITFILSLMGVAIGSRFGRRFENKAEAAGGIVLIIIGLKIFLEGIGII